jgi:L-threonylcarbamoyladenylate synthase
MGVESTVVDCTQPNPVLLRSGGITWEQLQQVRPDIIELAKVSEAVNSPGLRHRHYQPQAEVVLFEHPQNVTPDPACAMLTLKPHPEASLFGWYKKCDSIEDLAVSLFEFFREADRRGLRRIYCQKCDNTGLGRAITDRLLRASTREN